jgi:hypothetical protein
MEPWMALEIKQPKRASCSIDFSENLEDFITGIGNGLSPSSNRQYNHGILHLTMESSPSNHSHCTRNLSSAAAVEYNNSNDPPSRQIERNSGCFESTLLVGRLQDQERSTLTSSAPAKFLPYSGCLRSSNNETTRKILQLVARPKSSRKERFYNTMDQRKTASTSSN